MSSRSPYGGGCFYAGLFLLLIVYAFLDTHPRGTLIFLGALLLLSLIALRVKDGINYFVEQRRLKNTQCPHGMKGGLTLDLCSECKLEAEQAERERQRQIAESTHRQEIERKWRELIRRQIPRFEQANITKYEYLFGLSPPKFEDAVAELLRKLGYNVEQTRYSRDGGRDAIAKKGRTKYSIECKRYAKDRAVGRPELQKFFAAMKEDGCKKGLFITTGRFSKDAREYASRVEVEIELFDCDRLMALMQEAFPSTSTRYRVICRECGVTLTFSAASAVKSRPCRNGHRTTNPFYRTTVEELRELIGDHESKRRP